ncbi:MAG TPA: cysteine--tRNA ligase [Rhodothermales bacterium]
MDFRLYNTRTRSVEALRTLREGQLRFYACGPTVYSYAHIGNFRSFLTSDLIFRTAAAIGWDVVYATNITDVGHLTEDDYADAGGEDRMVRALRSKEGERFANIYDLARYYASVLLDDWRALNLREPTVRPRASEHVTDQIEAIERLIAAGHAYETSQGVYFHVPSFSKYGALSGNDAADQLEQSVRDVVVDPEKRDPRDFALWKKDEKHLMQWYSPFGRGFPGWHIECSVMALRYLGDELDLHAGGEDLIFPHHECEIAQSESLTGKTFARYWVHTRFLQVEGEKMSKSKGNFFTVRQLIAPEEDGGRGIDPLALRYALISGKYREPFNFTMKHLRDSAKVVRRYQDARAAVLEAAKGSEQNGEDRLGPRLDATYDATLEAMLDDLNTPIALARALEGVKLIQGFGPLDPGAARSALRWFERINALLGFVYPEDEGGAGKASTEATDPLAERVEALLAERTQARGRRDFARADAIRAELDDLGIEVMDRPDGTSWRRKI